MTGWVRRLGSLRQRSVLLQRSLQEGDPAVQSTAVGLLLEVWLGRQCSGDVIALLRFVEVVSNEAQGRQLLRMGLDRGAIPMPAGGERSLRHYLGREDTQPGGGEVTPVKLEVPAVRLMSAEEAFYWRNVCEFLQGVAAVRPSSPLPPPAPQPPSQPTHLTCACSLQEARLRLGGEGGVALCWRSKRRKPMRTWRPSSRKPWRTW